MAYHQVYGCKELKKGCVELNSPKRNKGQSRGAENESPTTN